MNKEILSKEIERNVKDLLFHHYVTDVSFPRSCGSVSMALALMLQNSNINNKYDITYERGHFRNDNEYDDCYCDMAEEGFNRYSCLEEFDCLNCTCEYMVGHSWVELVDKNTNEITILDFTSIQFEEDICDYENDLIENDFGVNTLYDYLSKRSKFIVKEDDIRFNNYIKSERSYTGQHILNETKDAINNDCVSILTVMFDAINYNI